MEPELARRSHAVLTGAAGLEGRAREAYLESECAGNAGLRSRVEHLLAAMNRTGGFLEAPALQNALPHAGSHELVGQEIGGYQVLRVIGAGGMATVYEALQEQPRRRVALKVMRRGLVGSSAVHRFEFETEVLARLHHPGIAQIYEAGASEDGHGISTPYFAMEYIADAAPITEYAERRGLPLRERFAMFAGVCDAVHHGHQLGVIHRDLKPGNILVDSHGRPKVIDFGVARSSEEGQAWITRQSDMGQLIGTLNYMSPEQCRADGTVDTRTDVYSLGVVLYQLVCGRLPHDLGSAPVPRALQIIMEAQPARPSAVNPAAGGDVEAIVLKAIEKDPERRYPSAAALGADLRRYLGHLTIEARPPTVLYQCRMFARRNRGLVAAAAGIILAIGAGGVVSAGFGIRATRESERRRLAETRAIGERDEALWQTYVANVAAAFGAFQAGEYQALRTRLAAAPEQHRGWEWRLLDGLAERSLRTIEAHDDMIFSFAVSPDGTRVATGGRDGSLKLWDPSSWVDPLTIEGTEEAAAFGLAFSGDGGSLVRGGYDGTVKVLDLAEGVRERTLGAHSTRVEGIACSSRGVIASASDAGDVKLWSLETGEMLRELPMQPGGVHGVAFKATGERLLTWNRSGRIRVLDAQGEPTDLELDFGALVEQAAFSPDGTLIAAGGSLGRVEIWNASTRASVHSLQTPWSVSTVRVLAFSPSGRTLAAGQNDRAITLWSVESGEPASRLRGHEEAISGLWMSPDGCELRSSSWDRTLRVWELEGEVAPEIITSLEGHEERVLCTAFSPDGSILVSGGADKRLRAWDPELGSELGVIGKHDGTVYSAAFSPDGRLIASGDAAKAVQVWRADTGARVGGHDGHTAVVWSVAFDPTGTRVASGGDDRTVQIWDIGSPEPAIRLEGHEARVTEVAFSPDGRLVASASRDGTVRLWDLAGGGDPRVLDEHDADVFSVLFSPDGRLVYSGSRDQSVRVWDVASGRREDVLDGHGQFITRLSMSPDGTRLAGGSWFGEVVLWDLATREVVCSFKSEENVVRAVSFGPGGRWLAVGGYEGVVRLFDASPQASRVEMRTAARRDRSAAEVLVAHLIEEHRHPEGAMGALASLPEVEPGVAAQARNLILARALAGGG